jgi:AcrR family transcriptional regulator
MEERVGETPPGAAKLHGLAQAYIAFAEHHNPRWNLLFDHAFEQAREMPEWYQQRLARVFGMVEEALPAIGEASDPFARVRIARVLWASVHGICMLKIRQRMELAGGQTTEQMTELLIDHFLAGLGGIAKAPLPEGDGLG